MKIVIRELQTSRYHKIKSVVSYLVMLGSLTSYCLKMIRKVISNNVLDWIQVNYEAQVMMMSGLKVEKGRQQPVVLN